MKLNPLPPRLTHIGFSNGLDMPEKNGITRFQGSTKITGGVGSIEYQSYTSAAFDYLKSQFDACSIYLSLIILALPVLFAWLYNLVAISLLLGKFTLNSLAISFMLLSMELTSLV